MFSFKRSLIALVGVLALVGALATMMPLVSRGQGGNPFDRDPRKSYYLTQTKHTGAQAPSACAAGYHMASLWEIFDTSNLRYDTALGFTQADSGFGPPVASPFGPPDLVDHPFGWIRTGGESFSTSFPGLANCTAWTSAAGDGSGTAVTLAPIWGVSGPVVDVTAVSPWRASTRTCDSTVRVWCMQD